MRSASPSESRKGEEDGEEALTTGEGAGGGRMEKVIMKLSLSLVGYASVSSSFSVLHSSGGEFYAGTRGLARQFFQSSGNTSWVFGLGTLPRGTS